jgi:hypothetical protein
MKNKEKVARARRKIANDLLSKFFQQIRNGKTLKLSRYTHFPMSCSLFARFFPFKNDSRKYEVYFNYRSAKFRTAEVQGFLRGNYELFAIDNIKGEWYKLA